jgi:predicted nucleotidyltransferase
MLQIQGNIKKSINEIIDADVYVFGSYYWGFWDELSDFDVTVEYGLKDNVLEINKALEVLKVLNIETDIQIKRGNMGILIP